MNASLAEIAAIVQGVVCGDENLRIQALAPLNDVSPVSLVFAEGSDNLKQAEASQAVAILIASHIDGVLKPAIKVANPFVALYSYSITSTPSVPLAEALPHLQSLPPM